MKRIYFSRVLPVLLLATFCILGGGGSSLKAQTVIFEETFDESTGSLTTWSGSDAQGTLKPDNTGWTFVKPYGAGGCAKFGTGSALGSATTPALRHSGDATLTFKAGAWKGDETTLKLSVVGTGRVSDATVTLENAKWTVYTVTLTDLTEDSKIKFEGNKTKNSRFFLDSVIVSIEGAPSYNAPTLDLEAGSHIIGKSLNITSEEGTKIVYAINDGSEVEGTSNSVSYRFPTTGKFTVKAKAVPVDASDEKGESSWTTETTYDIVEHIITPPSSDVVIWEEDFTGATSGSKPTEGTNATYTIVDGGSTSIIYSESYAGGDSPELLISKTNGALTATIDLKGSYGDFVLTFKSNNGCTVSTTTSGCNVSDYSFNKEDKNASCKVSVPEGTSELAIKFSNTTSSNTRVDNFLLVLPATDVEGAYYPFTMSSVGRSTLAAQKAYVMPEGLQGGIVTIDTENEEAEVTYLYKEGDVVPGGVALLLKGTANAEYHLALTEEEGATLEENCLVPAFTYDVIPATAGTKSYIFANDSERGLGFYYQGKTHDGSSVKDLYGKGYLSVPAEAAARGFSLKGSEATGIGVTQTETKAANKGIYTISGMRVTSSIEKLPAGVYIVNGKKVLVK